MGASLQPNIQTRRNSCLATGMHSALSSRRTTIVAEGTHHHLAHGSDIGLSPWEVASLVVSAGVDDELDGCDGEQVRPVTGRFAGERWNQVTGWRPCGMSTLEVGLFHYSMPRRCTCPCGRLEGSTRAVRHACRSGHRPARRVAYRFPGPHGGLFTGPDFYEPTHKVVSSKAGVHGCPPAGQSDCELAHLEAHTPSGRHANWQPGLIGGALGDMMRNRSSGGAASRSASTRRHPLRGLIEHWNTHTRGGRKGHLVVYTQGS